MSAKSSRSGRGLFPTPRKAVRMSACAKELNRRLNYSGFKLQKIACAKEQNRQTEVFHI